MAIVKFVPATERTLRPADKMTAEEWRAMRAERERIDAMWDVLARRLAWLDTHPLASCESCGQRHEAVKMPAGLCRGCAAWADRLIRRATRSIRRKREIARVAAEALEIVEAIDLSILSSEYHVISLRPFEEQLWETRAA